MNAKHKDGSWLPSNIISVGHDKPTRDDFGLALFQLSVGAIDSRSVARPGDLIAALAYLAGRAAQQVAISENARDVRLDQTGSGTIFILSDRASSLLGDMEAGSLASVLVDGALRAGAGRFPDFRLVRLQAWEAMIRRGECELLGQNLSDVPAALAGEIQLGFDALFQDSDSRDVLLRSAFNACRHAISYNRGHIHPADAAELAMSVALHASWLDRRVKTR